MQMIAIKCQNLVANVSRTGLMTHFLRERKITVVREPIPGKEETKLGKPLRLHAMNAQQWSTPLVDPVRDSRIHRDGSGMEPMFTEPHCRLLVILLVVSSLRISEYSQSTRRRIKPSGRDFLFSRKNQSKLGLLLLLA
jgi:hypothetical protein